MADTLRIAKNKLSMRLKIIGGREGDFYITYCSSLNISGYGRTRNEAEESINVSLKAFCEDFMQLSQKKRLSFLISHGWKQENIHNKNFSAVSVDEMGNLQNFNLEDVEVKVLDFA